MLSKRLHNQINILNSREVIRRIGVLVNAKNRTEEEEVELHHLNKVNEQGFAKLRKWESGVSMIRLTDPQKERLSPSFIASQTVVVFKGVEYWAAKDPEPVGTIAFNRK